MWKKASNVNAPLGRSSHTVSQVGGQIYVFGGEHLPRETIDNRLWAYNITTDSWNEVQTNGVPPQARLAHSATVVGTDIIFYAGRVTDKTGNNIYAIKKIANLYYSSGQICEPHRRKFLVAWNLPITHFARKLICVPS
jgi:N-acetylneuraminic acid mutarotase